MATQLNYNVENLSSERRKSFAQAEDEAELSRETGEFLCRIMKMDPAIDQQLHFCWRTNGLMEFRLLYPATEEVADTRGKNKGVFFSYAIRVLSVPFPMFYGPQISPITSFSISGSMALESPWNSQSVGFRPPLGR